MNTGDLLKKNKSAYEIDAELGGIGHFEDEDGNEVISILPRFSFNSGNQDKYKNADLLSYSPGFNVLSFKVGGSYPAAIGTSGLGHTATFTSLPNLTITNPSGLDEYNIFISPNKKNAPLQIGGQVFKQDNTPDFGYNYVAENPLQMYFTNQASSTTLTVRAGLRTFCPTGQNSLNQKQWANNYLSQTTNITSFPTISGNYYLLFNLDQTFSFCAVDNFWELDSLVRRPNESHKPTEDLYCFIKNSNTFYKRAANADSWVINPATIIAKVTIYNGTKITLISDIDPRGKQPVWFNTSIEPNKSQIYNIENSLWEDFDYIYAGYIKLASREQGALISAAVTNPYNYNKPTFNYTRFAVNDGRKNSKGEADLVVADLINKGLNISPEGYVSPNTTTGSTSHLEIPGYYYFYPSGNWEIQLDVQTTATAPAAAGQIFNCSLVTPNDYYERVFALNWTTGRVIQVYLSSIGTSWDIANASASSALAASTRYLLKLSFNGSVYKLEASTQITNPVWSTIWSLESTAKIFVPSQEFIQQSVKEGGKYNLLSAEGAEVALQLGLHLPNCYFKDGENKVWEGKNWKRVTAIAPFTYTDSAGVTKTQATNLSAEIQGSTGYQNFVIENEQLKPVGNIYRQYTEPDFVSEKAQVIYAPPTPFVYSGSSVTLKAGHSVLVPYGKTPEGYRIWDNIDFITDYTWTEPNRGSNAACYLFVMTSAGTVNSVNDNQGLAMLATIEQSKLFIQEAVPTATSGITQYWFKPSENTWYLSESTGTIWVKDTITVALLGTCTSNNGSISDVVPYTPQNGYPLWYDLSSEPYECYSYEP